MNWLTAYCADVRRYTAYGESGALRQVLTQQGLWALLQYRLASAVYQSALPAVLKRPLLLLMVVWQKLIEIAAGICLPYTAQIGAGLYIGHFGHIILNSGVVIGSECNLSQGVTIGVSGRGARRGVPVIGDRVYFGANATVAGKIRVGNDAVIGANSLVTSDVPDGCTVLGVPAEIISRKGSQDYIEPVKQ
ncbi:MAG TPA: DapH/DapD/GlmU-related protein [Blastocatellia bacterium]|nr:DapH/DapD/GlmU-related protein [Blastocatellia bacterium]HMV83900.1 DapH/DapD/GlmU-related protein [Blastocatellia bacterium]HMX28254.1 DapH/DapD/GlmU-related protein [Blastocatellia bacterium]HMY75678.1 DapH/DapD/GlmU-related protein [Blastocatellia bacterium]HMZ20227.1 DapH/DapD/GlmU-related protein [Blastocatellia bacterium]